MLEYVWIWLDWHDGFFIPCLVELVVTYFKKFYSLKELEAVFFFCFFFVFLRRESIFILDQLFLQVRFQICWGPRGTRGHEPWYTIISPRKSGFISGNQLGEFFYHLPPLQPHHPPPCIVKMQITIYFCLKFTNTNKKQKKPKKKRKKEILLLWTVSVENFTGSDYILFANF